MNTRYLRALCSFALSSALVFSATAFAAPRLPAINSPASAERLPGKFIWFDLATPQLEEQKAFYEYVFDWRFSPLEESGDGYTLILNGNEVIGGMFEYQPDGGEQDGATWIALMAVNDLDASLQKVQSSGGSTELAAASVPNRGRHALARDPGGALFGLLQSSSGDPSDSTVASGDFFWLDLFARDVEQQTAFYTGLAPYETTMQPIIEGVDRAILSAHGLARAGIVPVDEEANRSSWVPYIRVDDIELTLEKALAGGGFAIIPPDPALMDGRLAVFVDPNGAVIGIVDWPEGEVSQP